MPDIRKLILFILIILSLLVVSCNENADNTPELDINTPEIVYDELAELQGDWILDPTGHFSYLAMKPRGNTQPYFNEGLVFSDNIFIYEKTTSPSEKVKLYGYMDTEFNKLSNPISTQPNIFMYGHARIQTSDDSYIVNNSLEEVEEYYPGYILVNDSLIEVDWEQKFYREPYTISDVDPKTYIVPYGVKPEPDNARTEPIYGYKTLQDAYFNDTLVDEKFVIPANFQEAGLFCDGLAAVKQNEKWGFIDYEGNMVIECKYDNAKSLTHDVIALFLNEIYNDDNELLRSDRWALFDTTGNQLTPFQLREPDRFFDGLAAIGENPYKHFKLYNTEGEQVSYWLVNESGGPQAFHDGYIALRNADYARQFYDKTYSVAFPGNYSDIRNFSDGYAAIKRGKWGYINTNGERVIPFTYSVATDFSNGYAYVNIDTDNFSLTKEPGYLIDKHQNKYLKDLYLMGMTKFNEDGYALAYTIELNEHWVNIYEHDKNKLGLEPVYVLEMHEDKVYYMIHIEQP